MSLLDTIAGLAPKAELEQENIQEHENVTQVVEDAIAELSAVVNFDTDEFTADLLSDTTVSEALSNLDLLSNIEAHTSDIVQKLETEEELSDVELSAISATLNATTAFANDDEITLDTEAKKDGLLAKAKSKLSAAGAAIMEALRKAAKAVAEFAKRWLTKTGRLKGNLNSLAKKAKEVKGAPKQNSFKAVIPQLSGMDGKVGDVQEAMKFAANLSVVRPEVVFKDILEHEFTSSNRDKLDANSSINSFFVAFGNYIADSFGKFPVKDVGSKALNKIGVKGNFERASMSEEMPGASFLYIASTRTSLSTGIKRAVNAAKPVSSEISTLPTNEIETLANGCIKIIDTVDGNNKIVDKAIDDVVKKFADKFKKDQGSVPGLLKMFVRMAIKGIVSYMYQQSTYVLGLCAGLYKVGAMSLGQYSKDGKYVEIIDPNYGQNQLPAPGAA